MEGLSVSSSKDINGPVTAAKEGPMPPPVAAPNVLGSPSLAKKAPLVEHESRPPAPSSPLIQDNGAQKAASVVVDKASSLPGTPKKRRRSGTTVRFAPEILLLEICQNGDPRSKKDLETLRSLLFDASGKNGEFALEVLMCESQLNVNINVNLASPPRRQQTSHTCQRSLAFTMCLFNQPTCHRPAIDYRSRCQGQCPRL